VARGGRLRGDRDTVRALPLRARRVWRVAGPVAGVVAALLATAAGWPGAPRPAALGTTAQSAPGTTAQPRPGATARPGASVPGPARPGTTAAPGPWLLSPTAPVSIPRPTRRALPKVAPLRHLWPVDLVAVSAHRLPASSLAKVRHTRGVAVAQAVDAAQVQVNGRFVAVLGVDPSQFRGFAAKPTARDTRFWRGVAAGELGISYTMGKQDKLPAGSSVSVAGRHIETLPVGRFGTVGIGGIDAVVSHAVAVSLGFPVHNAIMISATGTANFAAVAKRVKKALPHSAAVDQIVVQSGQPGDGLAPTPGSPPQPAVNGLVTLTQVRQMLTAAESRVGMPYVWGAAGPRAFDCSGLVQWSFRQAGVIMPRVAADQARTGPSVPVRDLRPGDLLFYHTDPTAPDYISHVAIYLGDGKMIQAPEPGMDVEIVPVDLGSGFAGAIEVSPRIAAGVAATSV
jgi:peptidoglycan DL-endopeptidase CwlO